MGFWEQQKQEYIYLKNNPSHAGMFIGVDDEEAELDGLDVGTKNDDCTAI